MVRAWLYIRAVSNSGVARLDTIYTISWDWRASYNTDWTSWNLPPGWRYAQSAWPKPLFNVLNNGYQWEGKKGQRSWAPGARSNNSAPWSTHGQEWALTAVIRGTVAPLHPVGSELLLFIHSNISSVLHFQASIAWDIQVYLSYFVTVAKKRQ